MLTMGMSVEAMYSEPILVMVTIVLSAPFVPESGGHLES